MTKGNEKLASAAAAAMAPAPDGLGPRWKENATPDEVCPKLAKIFNLRATEIALLVLDHDLLRFIFPDELKTCGSIPVTSSNAVAANTATTRKTEVFNQFAQTKHASIFETVKLESVKGFDPAEHAPIQKLISAPVLDRQGDVLGVIQVSRKGRTLEAAGPDFTEDDVQRLESLASLLAEAHFMHDLSQ